MKTPKISIIIPTLNEEVYLPKLLDSIKKQDFKDYEIIVSDGGSKDRTIKVAKKYGCRVIKGKRHISVGRNDGAKISRGDILLFLDADGILPKGFLSSVYQEFQQRKLDCAAPYLAPSDKSIVYKISFFMFNSFNSITHFCLSGNCLMVKKSIHKLLKGFDENLWMCEDNVYVRRAHKIGRFGMLKSSKVYISVRRFEKEGFFKSIFRYTIAVFYSIMGKRISEKDIKFEHGKHVD